MFLQNAITITAQLIYHFLHLYHPAIKLSGFYYIIPRIYYLYNNANTNKLTYTSPYTYAFVRIDLDACADYRVKHLLLDKCSSNEDTRLIAVMARNVSPGQSCGTWLSMVAPNALMPCVLSFGSSHILLILLVSARYVMLTVWTHPYSLTFSAPIRMLLMVFQTSLILCGPQPHSQFLTLTPKYPIMI